MQNSSDNNFPQNRSGNRRRRPAARPKRQIHPKKKELMTQLQDIRTKMLDIAEEFNKPIQIFFVGASPINLSKGKTIDTKCLLSSGDELQLLARDEAARYLFLQWQIEYGRDVDYDLNKGLELFKNDIGKVLKNDEGRGRKESELVRKAKKMRADKVSYRAICKALVEGWDSLSPDEQQAKIRKLGDAVRKNQKRGRKKQDKL